MEAAQDGWAVLERAAELSRKGESFALATVVWRRGPSSGKSGSRAIVMPDGSRFGWIGGACAEPVLIRESLAALGDGEPRLLLLGMDGLVDPVPEGMISVPISCQSDGALQVHIEPVLPVPTVVVIGSSPMARTLVDLVAGIGWNGVLSEPSATMDIPAGASVVVATQGHGDEELLLSVVTSSPPYLGLVASGRRGELILSYLRDHGVPTGVIDGISVPAGIDLGATSHREMAVSILAELVAARARGELLGSAPPTAAITTAIDPVCKMDVTADESNRPLHHDGVTYYFCSPACRDRFASDPESQLRSIHADQE